MPAPGDEWATGDVPEEPEYTPKTLKGLLEALTGRCDCSSCKRDERERLAHVAAWEKREAHIEALEGTLRKISAGVINRSRNATYGGNKVGTLRREEMMSLASAALASGPPK